MRLATKKFDVGVIIGRFQVPELHRAHRDLIDYVRGEHARVIIVLGLSAVPGTRSNPLDFASRKQMIQEVYPDIDVVYLRDCCSDEIWSRELDQTVSCLLGPAATAVLYGSRDSFIKSYDGAFPVLELEADIPVSGSAIRQEMSRKARPSYDWRAGAIWQTFNRYRTVYTTVDAAIMTVGGTELLLGRKRDEELYRLIGGFADPRSESFEDDVLREAREEAGLCEKDIVAVTYVGSRNIDDWRYRNELDKIRTMLFRVTCQKCALAAADDISEVRWFPWSDVQTQFSGIVVPEHRHLITMLAQHLKG